MIKHKVFINPLNRNRIVFMTGYSFDDIKEGEVVNG